MYPSKPSAAARSRSSSCTSAIYSPTVTCDLSRTFPAWSRSTRVVAVPSRPPSVTTTYADPSLATALGLASVGFSGQTLWVVTTLDLPVEKLAALYARRWEIEADIRHLKQTLQADALRGQSPDMVLKELAMTAVAYNLVVQVRRLAAERAKVAPKRISFSAVRDLVRILLFAPKPRTAAEWVEWFERVVREAGRSKLPNRPNRSYPREVIPRRRGFPERKRKVQAVK